MFDPVLREVKGSKLSSAEGDQNMKDAKAEFGEVEKRTGTSTTQVLTFADALAGDHTGYDVVKTAYHTNLQYGGGQKYLEDGTNGPPSTGNEAKFFDATGRGFKADVCSIKLDSFQAYKSGDDWTPAYLHAVSVLGASGGVIELSSATYGMTELKIFDHVSIKGVSSGASKVYALSSSAPVGQDPTHGFIVLDDGAVHGVSLEDFTVTGEPTGDYNQPPTNAGQWGMYIRAKWDDFYTHGGLWYFKTENFYILNFDHGLWSRGSYTPLHSLLPNQFWRLENFVVRCYGTGGIGTRLTGQHGQINFLSGQSDSHTANSAFKNVEIGIDPDPSQVASDQHGESVLHVAGDANSIQGPMQTFFDDGFSVQLGAGVFVSYSMASFDHCWFESLKSSFTLGLNGNVSVGNTRFANAAVDGGAGAIVNHGAATKFVWKEGNSMVGTIDQFQTGGNNAHSISYLAPATIDTTSLSEDSFYQRTMGADGSLDVAGQNYVYVSSNTDRSVKLTSLVSGHLPGQFLTLRPVTGAMTIRHVAADMQYGITEMTFPRNATVVLQRKQGTGVQWALVSAQYEHYAAAAPTDGFYYAKGTVIRNSAPTSGSNDYWICTTAGLAGSTAVFTAK